MYNVNIKWGNSAHFLSLLLHTLVTQRAQSYTIHFCRGSEKKERGSFLPSVGMRKTNTESDRSAVGHLEIEDRAAMVALLLFIRPWFRNQIGQHSLKWSLAGESWRNCRENRGAQNRRRWKRRKEGNENSDTMNWEDFVLAKPTVSMRVTFPHLFATLKYGGL